jgi:hypothetical protein
MPKKGFTIEGVQNLLSSANDKPGWTLCIGSGTSIPLFPDWYTLAEKMATEMVPDKTFNISDIKECGFSPDAIIQMVKNSVAIDDIEFINQMSGILYKKLKSKILTDDWASIVKVLGANNISSCAISKWKIFSKYRDTILNTTSAYQIAPIILEAIKQGNGPQSILSFNAEPLLFSILNSFMVDGCKQPPKKMFNKVINSITNQGLGMIPYVFCHGLLPVTENPHKFSTSVDKLVFLEEEYLHIANNSFSWQSATFLSSCVSQHIVFIGTSLTDPNMRRWLSWTHANRLNEMKQNGLDIKNSTQHYWIRTIPINEDVMPWIEAAVSHLGIRIIWIKEWNQLGLALKKMLGLSSNKS